MSDRHLGQSAIFLYELARCTRQQDETSNPSEKLFCAYLEENKNISQDEQESDFELEISRVLERI